MINAAEVFTIFTIFQLCRRGQQGVCDLKKESIRLFESNGQQYWRKVEGEATKNHQHDSEDVLRDGAYILMENNSYGFNPGLYINLFLSKLNKDTEDLFSRPIRPQKSFKLHENPEVQSWSQGGCQNTAKNV